MSCREVILKLSVMLCAVTAALQVSAQSKSPNPGTVDRDSLMFNARQYSLQKRYRAADKTAYPRKDFLSATYVSAGMSVFVPMMPDYSYGPSGQVNVGHVFGRYHHVQIGLDGGVYDDAFYGSRLGRVMVSASYMFDLTTYLMGYDPDRICDFSFGAGADWMYKWSGTQPSQNGGHFGLHFALQTDLHVLKYVDVFLTPAFYAFKDGNSTIHSDNWREIMPAFGASAGCRFYMGEVNWRDRMPGLQTYFIAGSGAKLQNSSQVRNLPERQRGGFDLYFGAGRHFTDAFDMRVIVEYARYNWAESMNGTILPTHNASLGVDGVVDFLALCTRRGNIPASISAVAGPRLGVFKKCGATGVETLTRLYAGFYTGGQIKVRLPLNIRIFVEPGVTFIPYMAPSLDSHYAGVNKSHYDAVMGLNVGLEYALPLR